MLNAKVVLALVTLFGATSFGCGSESVEVELLRTAHGELTAVSVEAGDGHILTQLWSADQVVGSFWQDPASGEAELVVGELQQSGTPVEDLRTVHELLASVHGSLNASEAVEVDYGCAIGGYPIVCGQFYCDFPNPGNYGGWAYGSGSWTEAQCQQQCSSCPQNYGNHLYQRYFVSNWAFSMCFCY